MTGLFLKFLNMSISASWIVLTVVVLRAFLKKPPRWIICVLWGVVALRLLVPVTMESVLSLIPSPEVFPQEIITSQTPAIHSGIPVVNSTVNPLLTQHVIEGTNTLDMVLFGATVAWVTGAVLMLGYGLVSSIALHRQVSAYIPGGENIRLCDQVFSPFVLGIIHPKIYIPSGLDEKTMEYVLSHEKAHIQRKDHWWKPLGFLLLSLHWFNPLLWLAYVLLCRDIERACDEKVIDGMTAAEKKGYSGALLACSVHRRMIMACPVAFGEIGIKARIKGVASFKKPTFWSAIVAIVLCVVTAVCFLTNPKPCQHQYESAVTLAATCTEQGIEELTCQLCQHSYSVPQEKLPHSYDEGVVCRKPTCVEQGEAELTCTACGEKKTQVLETEAHIPGEIVMAKEPNCTHTGEMTTVCTYCQTEYVVEVLPTNNNHNLAVEVVQASTCTQCGEGWGVCTLCGHEEVFTLELAEHNFKHHRTDPPLCIHQGEEIELCTQCGEMRVTKIPATGKHDWEDRDPQTGFCSGCGRYKYQ